MHLSLTHAGSIKRYPVELYKRDNAILHYVTQLLLLYFFRVNMNELIDILSLLRSF